MIRFYYFLSIYALILLPGTLLADCRIISAYTPVLTEATEVLSESLGLIETPLDTFKDLVTLRSQPVPKFGFQFSHPIRSTTENIGNLIRAPLWIPSAMGIGKYKDHHQKLVLTVSAGRNKRTLELFLANDLCRSLNAFYKEVDVIIPSYFDKESLLLALRKHGDSDTDFAFVGHSNDLLWQVFFLKKGILSLSSAELFDLGYKNYYLGGCMSKRSLGEIKKGTIVYAFENSTSEIFYLAKHPDLLHHGDKDVSNLVPTLKGAAFNYYSAFAQWIHNAQMETSDRPDRLEGKEDLRVEPTEEANHADPANDGQ